MNMNSKIPSNISSHMTSKMTSKMDNNINPHTKKYTTTNRRMEQFLFTHFIPFIRQFKDENWQTVWVYEDSEELRRVVAEYEQLIEQNKELPNCYQL